MSLTMVAEVEKLNLETLDNKILEVGMEVIQDCNVLQNACTFALVTPEPLPVDIDSKTLQAVIDFSSLFTVGATYVPPTTSLDPLNKMPSYNSPAVKFFDNFSNKFISSIVHAACYLDNDRLVDHCAYAIWKRAHNLSVDQLCDYFNITTPFTAEERNKLSANEWVAETP